MLTSALISYCKPSSLCAPHPKKKTTRTHIILHLILIGVGAIWVRAHWPLCFFLVLRFQDVLCTESITSLRTCHYMTWCFFPPQCTSKAGGLDIEDLSGCRIKVWWPMDKKWVLFPSILGRARKAKESLRPYIYCHKRTWSIILAMRLRFQKTF